MTVSHRNPGGVIDNKHTFSNGNYLFALYKLGAKCSNVTEVVYLSLVFSPRVFSLRLRDPLISSTSGACLNIAHAYVRAG
jgi:hypothetical protein